MRRRVVFFPHSWQGITMAGNMQFAAKLLLGTTVLASGGGGVYYASTHGWSLPGLSHEATRSATTSDLDAIASGWSAEPASGEPASSKPAGDAVSSPVARSVAEVTEHS